MSEEFLLVLNYFLHNTEAPVINNWDLVYHDFCCHGLCPLAGKKIDKLAMPKEIKTKWQNIANQQLLLYLRTANEQNRLTDILEKQGIIPIVLKGFSAAQYYDEIHCRTIGDIDFLVNGEDNFKHAYHILKDNDYVCNEPLEISIYSYNRHISFNKNKVRFEMHRYFSNKNNSYDDQLDDVLKEAEAVKRDIQGFSFYSFNDLYNGLVILEHLHHHLQSSGVGLRQVVDWYYYVDKVLSDEFWNREFKNLVCSLKLEKLAVHLTRMCEIYLGLSEHQFSRDADDEVVALLFKEIFEAGNFGRNKDKLNNRMSGFMRSGNVFVRLQKGGLHSWAALKKYPILTPFAWLYQLFKIIGVLLRSGKTFKHLNDAKDEADELEYLLKKVGASKYRNS